MSKKSYEKPGMKVIKLRHRLQMLVGSVTATRSEYQTVDPSTWE